jgi:hypothetical protein
MAADSALGGVLQKNADHLPTKTQELLKTVQVKFQSKPGAEHAGQGGNGSNGAGNGGTGHDTLTGGHDTMVGGHDAGISVTKLGAMKLPDLSGLKAVGAVAPVGLSGIPSAASAADSVIVKAAPAAQVDLTLVGQSVDALTKKITKLGGGGD